VDAIDCFCRCAECLKGKVDATQRLEGVGEDGEVPASDLTLGLGSIFKGILGLEGRGCGERVGYWFGV
jgi:hypothetical protein